MVKSDNGDTHKRHIDQIRNIGKNISNEFMPWNSPLDDNDNSKIDQNIIINNDPSNNSQIENNNTSNNSNGNNADKND